ncbi:MAG: hypothetical protein KatS3mg002_0373 [Candidatus Woesearchaeota archaeon]|nr:MAG: hypothetical protein KatS3mg002_0373 [Candidatus Woesearchaeota archaeon]
MVGTKNGFLNYYDDYGYDDETGNIILYNVDRRYSECDIIELFVYKPLNKEFFTHPPKIVSVPPDRVNYKEKYIYNVKVEDLDPNESFRFELNEYPEGMGIDPFTGSITWNNIQFSDIGDHTVKFTVYDKYNLSDSQIYTLRVYSDNKSPILSPIPDQIVYQGDTISFAFNYTDETPDTVNFTYELLTPGLTGNIQIDNITKSFTYISENDTPEGTYQIKITATDEGRRII